MVGILENLLDMMDHPPEPNCSCHLSAPCSDCENYSGLRMAIADAETYIANHQAKGETNT